MLMVPQVGKLDILFLALVANSLFGHLSSRCVYFNSPTHFELTTVGDNISCCMLLFVWNFLSLQSLYHFSLCCCHKVCRFSGPSFCGDLFSSVDSALSFFFLSPSIPVYFQLFPLSSLGLAMGLHGGKLAKLSGFCETQMDHMLRLSPNMVIIMIDIRWAPQSCRVLWCFCPLKGRVSPYCAEVTVPADSGVRVTLSWTPGSWVQVVGFRVWHRNGKSLEG